MTVLRPEEETLLETILSYAEGYVEMKRENVDKEFPKKTNEEKKEIYKIIDSAQTNIDNGRIILERLELVKQRGE